MSFCFLINVHVVVEAWFHPPLCVLYDHVLPHQCMSFPFWHVWVLQTHEHMTPKLLLGDIHTQVTQGHPAELHPTRHQRLCFPRMSFTAPVYNSFVLVSPLCPTHHSQLSQQEIQDRPVSHLFIIFASQTESETNMFSASMFQVRLENQAVAKSGNGSKVLVVHQTLVLHHWCGMCPAGHQHNENMLSVVLSSRYWWRSDIKWPVAGQIYIWYILSLWAPSLFHRQNGIGIGSMCARTGGVLAPMMYLLRNISPKVPMVLCGLCPLLGSALTLLLPETANQALPDTIEDVEGPSFRWEMSIITWPITNCDSCNCRHRLDSFG